MVMFIALSFQGNFFCLASFPQITSSCDNRLGTFITEHLADELHITPSKDNGKTWRSKVRVTFLRSQRMHREREKERTHTSACSQPCGSRPNFLVNTGAKSQARSPCLKWLLKDLAYWCLTDRWGSTMAAGVTIEQSFQHKCWYLSSKLHSTSQQHCFISEISWNRSERETKDSTSFFTTTTLMPVWFAICITGSFRGVNPHLITWEILNVQWFVCS